MRAIVPLCTLATCAVLAVLAHAAIVDAMRPKPIEIIHMPRFLSTGARAEKVYAEKRGVPVLFSLDELKAWLAESVAA